MTLDEIREQWANDCHIDDLHLDKAAANSPHLHSKYLNELLSAKLKLTKLNFDLVNLKVKKAKYFRGEMTKEELQELGWEQWNYRSLKSDIEQLIEADSDVQTILARVEYIKAIIFFLESVLGEIKARSFHVKNILEWQKFRAGA
jgi:hypothetical protein